MNNELKQVAIGGREFAVVKLDAWKRLAFLADLQKEFLTPALSHIDLDQIGGAFDQEQPNTAQLLTLIAGFSNLIDGKSLEIWMRRILAEGMVIYTRDDGQRAKMAFSEIDALFAGPTDIIMLLKEVLLFNMDDLGSLLGKVGKGGKVVAV